MIEDGGLARCNAVFWIGEADRDRRVVAQRAFERYRNRLGETADLGGQLPRRQRADAIRLDDPCGPNGEQALGSDANLAGVRIDTDHVERFGLTADLQAPALADRVMDHAPVLAERLSGFRMDDRARHAAFGAHLLDDLGVIAVGHEADILTVGLGRVAQACRFGQFTHLAFGQAAKRKAQIGELILGRRIEEIGLVARRIVCAVQFGPRFAHHPAHVMAGGEAVRPQLARHREQIGEFRAHIAADAGHRRAPGEIFVGKGFDHILAKGAFMVVDVMGDAESVGYGARIGDIVARAACALATRRRAVIVQLQGDADHARTARGGQRSDDRTVDTARHRNHDRAVGSRAGKIEQGGCALGREGWGREGNRGVHDPAALTRRGRIAKPPAGPFARANLGFTDRLPRGPID